METLNGKLVIISGAGSGIGKTACEILVREGAKVIAADRNFEAVKNTQNLLGESVYAIQLDVSSSKSVSAALKEIVTVFNAPPSIMVNAAGITKESKEIINMSEGDFDDVINVNLKGTFLMMQTFGKAMVEHGVVDGSIVNMSSIMGKTGAAGFANYSASKAGVDALTKTASKELGKHGIRVNAILPAFIVTPMTDPLPEAFRDLYLETCSLRRFGQPSEVGELIAFLASQKSSYINGATVECTGGM